MKFLFYQIFANCADFTYIHSLVFDQFGSESFQDGQAKFLGVDLGSFGPVIDQVDVSVLFFWALVLWFFVCASQVQLFQYTR